MLSEVATQTSSFYCGVVQVNNYIQLPRFHGDDYFAASSVLANEVKPCLTIASWVAGT